MYRLTALLGIIFHCLFASLGFTGEQVIDSNGLKIWCEDFGDRNHPPLLLIMGCDCQGIMWHDTFCQKLTNAGYFVIRYDHRDTGLSSTVEPEQRPYDLLDMAKDAVGILDYYHIEKAHIVGASMGGLITQLIAVHFPDRIATATLMSTSCDFSVLLDVFEGKENNSPLSKPTTEFLTWMSGYRNLSVLTDYEQEKAFSIRGWQLLNGPTEFDKDLYLDLHKREAARSDNPFSSSQHFAAIKQSLDSSAYIARNITVPTLILHGTHDHIFPLDHGQALAECIEGSTLTILQDMGHNLNPVFYDSLVTHISAHTEPQVCVGKGP